MIAFIFRHLQRAGRADARRAQSPRGPAPSHRTTRGKGHSGKFPGHQERLLRYPADGPCRGEEESDGQSMHSKICVMTTQICMREEV